MFKKFIFVLQVLVAAFLFSACELSEEDEENTNTETPWGAPQNLQAESVSGGIKLTWSAVSSASYYYIYRATTEYSYYYSNIGVSYETNYTDTSVMDGITYYYKVTAFLLLDYSGYFIESDYSSVVSCTYGYNSDSIRVPYNLSAESASAGIKLTWDEVSSASYYNIYRATTDYSYSNIGTAYETTYTDTSVSNGTTYYYKVSAVSSSGTESNYSSVVSYTYRSVPNNLTAVSASAGIKLTWDEVSSASYYKIYRATTDYSYYYSNIGTAYEPNYTDTSVSDGYTYYYKVKAVLSDYTESDYSNVVSCVKSSSLVNEPGPSNLTCTGKTANSITLQWDAVSIAASYKLYRSEVSASSVVDIGETISGTAYTDTGLTSKTRYYYKVTAVDSNGGETEKSKSINVTTD